MADRAFTQSLIYSTETLIFSILALLLLAYYRGLGRQYVKFWMLSLFALAINQFALTVQSVFSEQTPSNVIDIAIALVRHISHYLHFLFLMLGIYSATKQEKITPSTILIGLSVAISISTIATLLYGFDSNSVFNRFYLRESLPAFVFGCGFIAAACYLYSSNIVHFSSRVLLAYCIFAGIRFVAYSFASIVSLTDDWFRYLSEYLIYIDMGLHTVLGFVILIWMQVAKDMSRQQPLIGQNI
mgnify:FL=1|tara:strand:- start:287 stop:1012 length:726 start_codon:yes stop_codon:yes gene_type:complete